MAVLGYVMYGDKLKSQVTLNLPIEKLSSKIAIYTALVNPITKYSIIISPIAIALEESRLVSNNGLCIRTVLVVSTTVVALVLPFFGYLMAFIGAFLGVSAAIVFPCLCYLKINKPSLLELMFLLLILIFGFVVAATGTFSSVRDIVEHVHIK